MALRDTAAKRVERFLAAHPTGPLVVCVGSASVAGIVWLAERSRGRPVTLLIGESWPLKILNHDEERTRDAVGRATATLCLFRTPDEIAEPAHQRGEQLQAA